MSRSIKKPDALETVVLKNFTKFVVVFLTIITIVSTYTAIMYRLKFIETTKQSFDSSTSSKLGDIITGNGFIYNLTDIRTDKQSIPSYWELDASNMFLLVRLSLKNTSTQVLEFSPVSTMQVRDESGATHEVSSAPGIRDSLGGPINPGQTVSGEVGFTVPKTMNSGFVIYAPAQADQHIITTAISLP